MKTIIRNFALVLLGLSLSPIAHAKGFCCDTKLFRPFIGIDVQGRDFGFEHNYGGNLFKNDLVQYDAYVGARFFKYLGLTVGFEETENKGRHAFLQPGDYYLGLPIVAGDPTETHETQTRIKGVHLDLTAFIPLCLPMCSNYGIDFFVSGGIVHNTIQLSDHLVALNGVPLDPITNAEVRTYRDNKTVSRFSLGLQKVFCEHVGLRAMVAWENTDRLKYLKADYPSHLDRNVNVKDSFIYGVGIFLIA